MFGQVRTVQPRPRPVLLGLQRLGGARWPG